LNVRIGLVSDTHCPEFVDRLPDRLLDALGEVDLILHAGDVTAAATLQQLEARAPVLAVRGDHDSELDQLPRRRTLELAGKTVAMVHGNRTRVLEEPITFLGTVSLGHIYPSAGLDRWLTGIFPGVDVIVHGHTHEPRIRLRGGTVIVNPGAVYQVTPEAARRRLQRGPNWFEWSWLQVARHRRRLHAPSIAILDIRGGSVAASIVPL
jgi:putative phosphoesterase